MLSLNWNLVFWTALTEACELLALYNLKKYVATQDRMNLFAGMGIYSITGYLLTHSIEAGGLGVSNALWNSFSNLAGVWVGMHYFGEELDGHQWLGVLLGIGSSFFLSEIH